MPDETRSFWKGHLRLALVTIPIRLVSAVSVSGATRLNQIDRKSRQRIRYLKVAADSGQPVEARDIVKGVEIEPGRYVLLTDEDLDSLKLETRHTLDLQSFVDADEIDPIYNERPYYVLPDGDIAEEGYRVIADALGEAGKVGIGQLAMRGRENLVALRAYGGGLILETLRYAPEIRDASRTFAPLATVPVRPGLREMAMKLIDERTTSFDPSRYHDRYEEALADLVKAKKAGPGAVEIGGGEERPASADVVDFMEALRRSLGDDGGKGKAASSPAPRTRKRAIASASKAAATKRTKPPAADTAPPPRPSRTRRSSR
jgi:DNA end-binding protein Ku